MMHLNKLIRKSCSAPIVLALAVSTIFTTGCANMASTAVGGTSLGEGATITGSVHGGNQPVVGATVTLNLAGITGQGSTGSVIATATSGANGSFTFVQDSTTGDTWPSTGPEYSCPTAGNNPIVYLVSKGGNTQGSGTAVNPAAVFIAILGPCRNVSPTAFIDVTEVSTVASMAAMQQYFNPATEVFGANGTGIANQAITNAAGLVSNLVSTATGQVVTSTSLTNAHINLIYNTGLVTVTATPESAKINTIANILASCVNTATGSTTSGTPCATLFSNATPPAGDSTATDVLQAAYYMLANPSNGSVANLTALYQLPVTVGAPFTPALTAQPSDWTIAITYTASGNCGTTTPAVNNGVFINSPYSMSSDASGDVWFANAGSGNLSEFNPYGAPLVCIPAGTVGTTAANTIDSSGKIWAGTNGATGLTRYTNTTSDTIVDFTTSEVPLALTADGSGNVYYTSAAGNLHKLAAAASATTSVADTVIGTGLGTPSGLLIDGSGAAWITSGTSSVTRIRGNSTTPFTTASPTYGIAVSALIGSNDTDNVFFTLQGTTDEADNILGNSGTYSTVANWPTTAALGGLSGAAGIAADSKANLWIANNTNTTSGTVTSGSISEIVTSGTSPAALSPSTGFDKATNVLNNSRAVVIDISGNVWVGGDGNNFVTEIVGAAAPVYQPFAVALAGSALFQNLP